MSKRKEGEVEGEGREGETELKNPQGSTKPAMRAVSRVNETGHSLLPTQEFKVNSRNFVDSRPPLTRVYKVRRQAQGCPWSTEHFEPITKGHPSVPTILAPQPIVTKTHSGPAYAV